MIINNNNNNNNRYIPVPVGCTIENKDPETLTTITNIGDVFSYSVHELIHIYLNCVSEIDVLTDGE